jgi:hypothetical protein
MKMWESLILALLAPLKNQILSKYQNSYAVHIISNLINKKVALGGLVVACLPLDARFAGSNLAKDDAF